MLRIGAAMPRPLSFVRLDIARFGAEISGLNDAQLSEWTRTLFRCLALQDASIHGFGASLLNESIEFRKSESERKKDYFRRKDAERRGLPNHNITDHSRSDHSRSKQNKKERANTNGAFSPAAHSIYGLYHGSLKASTRKTDALRWIDRRLQEYSATDLVLSVYLYSEECKKKKTEEKFFKDCANFFGEDSAFEGFLPDKDASDYSQSTEWAQKNLDKEMANG